MYEESAAFLYFSRVPHSKPSFPLFLAALLLGVSCVPAQMDWGMESGAASHGYFTIAGSPRVAALSGAGLADPSGATDASWNPMAAAFAKGSQVQGSQARLSERLGANYNILQVIQPAGPVRILGGLNFLDVEALEGRDDLSNSTGQFGAFAWAGRLGLASDSGAFVWGVQGSFSHYNIEQYNSRSVLADVVLGYSILKHLRFAAGVFHAGWVEEFDTAKEYAPMTLQAGLSYQLSLPGFLAWTVHTDLRRQTDGPKEVLLGLETFYTKVLVLRLGLDATAKDLAPSGGIGLMLGPMEASYAYQSNKALLGTHHFGLGYCF